MYPNTTLHTRRRFILKLVYFIQHVDEENSYLCGYLKITGLTSEYPMLTTFFDGEIISRKYPFLTRKWDADEDVDRKHWVSSDIYYLSRIRLTCLAYRAEQILGVPHGL